MGLLLQNVNKSAFKFKDANKCYENDLVDVIEKFTLPTENTPLPGVEGINCIVY